MKALSGKSIVITAGPTREYIDPVRYISNDSSGKMGFALAAEAVKLGARVTLIAGPVDQVPPKGVRHLSVVSAKEMFVKVKKYYKNADIIICSAAVADFRPAKFSKHKIKKNVASKLALTKTGRASSAATTLKLIRNPDILAWLGGHKKVGQRLIGFALETKNLIKNAKTKLMGKNCDLIIANYSSAIGSDKSSAVFLNKDGIVGKVSLGRKRDIARKVLKLVNG